MRCIDYIMEPVARAQGKKEIDEEARAVAKRAKENPTPHNLNALIHVSLTTVHGTVGRFGLPREDALDVVNKAMFKATAKETLEQWNPRLPWKAYLAKIAVNECIDHLRKQQKTPTLSFTETDASQAFVDITGKANNSGMNWEERLVFREALANALNKLKAEHREVFILRYIEELDEKGTAEVLGISVDAVKNRAFRARAALRELLKEHIRY